MLNQFSRTQLIYGETAMRKLAASRVAVFGIAHQALWGSCGVDCEFCSGCDKAGSFTAVSRRWKDRQHLLTLLAEEGFDEAWLNMIHTPIGLKIGAETPAEIEVSICAEMIQHCRSHSIEESDEVLDRTDTDFAMLHFLAEAHGPAALMMVISTHDSTPVKSGTIMVMERIGRSFGTLGGGCGEAEVMRVAREMIGTGGSQVVEIEMSNDIAGDEGMVCGGSMRVLVEDIEP